MTSELRDSTDRPTVAAISRAVDVLDLFVQRPDLGVTEIARALDLSKAVVHRILTTLSEHHLIEFDPTTRRYGLGSMALALGQAYLSRLDVRALAAPRLRMLSDAVNETATLSIRRGWERIYLDQAVPNRDIRMSVTLGAAFPLHAGSSSKAFLAFLPVEEQERYIHDHGLEPLTASTPTDPDALRADLRAIRERGYAESLGERQAGATSVAAPVLDHVRQPVAVISVCGPSERFGEHLDESVSQLLAVTTELSRVYGTPA